MDTKLKFTYHIDKAIEKGYKKLGLICRMTKLPFTFCRMYLQADIIPLVFFASVVWVWSISQTTWDKMDKFMRQWLLKLTSCFKTSSYASLYLLTSFLFSQWQAYLLAGRCIIRLHRKGIEIQWNCRSNSYHTKLHIGFDTILEQSQVTNTQLDFLRNTIVSRSHTTSSIERAILKQQYSNLED